METGERLARIEALLAEHMRRTELLETSVEMLRKEFEPVKAHVALAGALPTVLIGAAGLFGTIVGIILGLRALL